MILLVAQPSALVTDKDGRLLITGQKYTHKSRGGSSFTGECTVFSTLFVRLRGPRGAVRTYKPWAVRRAPQ